MEMKVVQLYRIIKSCKVICLLLIFIIGFQINSRAQVHKIDSIPVVNLGPDGNVCSNEPRLLNAYNEGCTYEWKRNDSIISDSSYIYASKSGTYSVKVLNSDSITAYDTIKLRALEPPKFSINAVGFNKYDFTLYFSSTLTPGGYLYLWNFGDPSSNNNTSQLPNPYHTFNNLDTWITLTMFDVRTNCTNTDSFRIDSWMFFWGINNELNELYKVGVSPNPISTSSKLSFIVKNPSSTVSLKAYDLLGKERNVLFENKIFFQGENSIELTSLFNSVDSGFSLLKLSIDGIPMSIKVVK